MSDDEEFRNRVEEIREKRESEEDRTKNPTVMDIREASMSELYQLDECPVCLEPFDAVAKGKKLGRLEDVGVCLHGEVVFLHGDGAKVPSTKGAVLSDEGPRGTFVEVECHGPGQYFQVENKTKE